MEKKMETTLRGGPWALSGRLRGFEHICYHRGLGCRAEASRLTGVSGRLGG